jgi:hypothetical protein
MLRANQPYLLLDIHVKGHHLRNLRKKIVDLLDLQIRPSRLHFYTVSEETQVIVPVEQVQ